MTVESARDPQSFVRVVSPNKKVEKLGFGTRESRNLEFQTSRVKVANAESDY